jgi:TM2 domain-containing membrane protein YozV
MVYAGVLIAPVFADVAQSSRRLLPSVGNFGRFSVRGGLPSSAFLVSTLIALAVSMQGCDFDVPAHTVGNWRSEPDYLIAYEFIPPGGSPRNAMLNSCMLERLSSTLQCNGRGVCKRWNNDDLENPTAFCECDRDWADPECRTRRKSQATAYVLSLFFGYLGADYFYLGNSVVGVIKFVTLGGAGVWWAIDVIRIGSAPVQGGAFKTAADLPHWAFVLSTVSVAVLVGFIIAWNTAINHIQQRRKDAFLMQMEEEARMTRPSDGKTLAKLVPPELVRPMPPEGPKIWMEGREDFNKPTPAPNWAVMGKSAPYPGASWYGATGEEDRQAELKSALKPNDKLPPSMPGATLPPLPPSIPGSAQMPAMPPPTASGPASFAGQAVPSSMPQMPQGTEEWGQMGAPFGSVPQTLAQSDPMSPPGVPSPPSAMMPGSIPRTLTPGPMPPGTMPPSSLPLGSMPGPIGC